MFKNKGFTLLEMLVVIGLIGVILSLGATSYSTTQKKARDSKRKSELRAIQSSLEQYYSICGFNYPVIGAGTGVPTIGCTNPSTLIMPTAPRDPKSGVLYEMVSDGSTYSICVPDPTGAAGPLEVEPSVTGYCLNNQQ